MPAAPVNRSRSRNTVVSAAPTSTTKITGFFASVTGFSLKKDSLRAFPAISVSNNGRARASFLGRREVRSSVTGGVMFGGGIVVDMGLEQLSLVHQIMLHDRSERKRGKERQRSNDNDSAYQQPNEQGPMRRKRSAGSGYSLLGGQAASGRQQRQQKQETADQHCQADGQVVPGRIGAETAKGAAIIRRSAGECVKHFGESVRSAIGEVAHRGAGGVPITVLVEGNHSADGGEHQDAGGGCDHCHH